MASRLRGATGYGSGPMPRACSRSTTPRWWSTETNRLSSRWTGTLHSINRRAAINAESQGTYGEGGEKVKSEGRRGRREEKAGTSFACSWFHGLGPTLLPHGTNLRFDAFPSPLAESFVIQHFSSVFEPAIKALLVRPMAIRTPSTPCVGVGVSCEYADCSRQRRVPVTKVKNPPLVKDKG
jgi:hypothetical protein